MRPFVATRRYSVDGYEDPLIRWSSDEPWSHGRPDRQRRVTSGDEAQDQESRRHLRVLLISPVRSLDPWGGDVTYTEDLLASPPAAVTFETYDAAIARGALVEITGRSVLARGCRHVRTREAVTALAFSVVNRFRRTPALFSEPLRLFWLKPGEWDLVHTHVFSARFPNLNIPLVVSNAATLDELYRDAFGWSKRRVGFAHRFDVLLARVAGVNLSWGRMPQASRILPFTGLLAPVLAQANPTTPVEVLPNYLDPSDFRRGPATAHPFRVGFVAKDFAAKGGEVLLEAWKSVSRAFPEATLTLVGSTQQPPALPSSVHWMPFVNRAELIEEILPSFDIFAYPTNCDGLPFVLLEAMRAAIPVVSSDYGALPEVVGNAGLIVPRNKPAALATAILDLLDPATNQLYTSAAADRFDTTFSAEVVTVKLRRAYERAVADYKTTANRSV